ncbi:protein unc-13 homolog 4B-like isoform X2 [Panulirus ornatus]|uniref:protein unc-13 homolog 4B-like isoform X2 n=1 Tax=Panulirus ornatus TaxID=150431 RepID=UPI003A87FEE5
MFKTCTLALKKSWKNMHLVTPGSAKGEQKKDNSEHLREVGLGRDIGAPTTKNWKGGGGGVGSIHLERRSEEHGTLVAAHVFRSWPPDGHRRAYQNALTNSVHQYLATTAQGGDDRCRLWSGQLSQKATAELSQLGVELHVSEAVQQLTWWLVGSRLASVDAAWAFTQLQHVQSALALDAYQEDDVHELLHSLTLYIYSQIKRLKSLHSAFPSSAGSQSSRQLTYTLRTLQNLQSHRATRQLLDQVGQPVVHEDVVAALQRHAQDWWTGVLQASQNQKTKEEQLHVTVEVASMVLTLLEQDSKFYDDVFKKEMRVSHTAISYQEVSSRLADSVRSLLTPASFSNQEEQLKLSVVEDFSMGSPLWSLYKNLGHIHSFGEHLGGQGTCGPTRVHSYLGYFMGSVATWLTHTQHSTHLLIQEALLQDTLHSDVPAGSQSPSLQELLRAFVKVQKWWEELAWPEAETCGVLLVLVLETLCSLATTYCQRLTDVSSSSPPTPLDFKSICFDVMFCIHLASMSRAVEEVKQLTDELWLDKVLEKVRRCSNSGAASQVKTTVETLISSVTHNLETLLDQVIEKNIDMVKLRLSNAVQRVCEEGSIVPLVDQVLHPTLALLQEHLPASISQHFLLRLWDALLVIYMVTVAEKSEKKPTNHFSDVYCLLESTFHLFTDYGNLDPQAVRTPGYISLLEQLEEQRVPTVILITQYYEARYLEQTQHHLPTTAHILVRMFFSQPGRLTVRVFEARDMALVKSRCSSRSQPQYFVIVQVVPHEMFPSAAVCRTWATKEYPASFYETFEFPSGVVTSESSGLLQLILMHRGSCGGTFLGEALMPLAAVPYVDSPEVQNTCLRMTAPNFQPGYKSLILLQSRTEDELAMSFIKMIERQHPEVKNIKTKGERYYKKQ